ncbi:MAG: AAA family ATPase, partial [Pseudomonadota bacterium]
MQFSKLRLVGFKSFVDPTELIIADGLTGVVGPNGCGKSNLLEALRWVMGENRPTAMRGGGMEDVIFAGAATRPARNFAEVALTLDNRDRRAPPTFNSADALDVVRRITRDAGSAYKTNGKDTRARDVQMLFADVSTGAHSPALVRQGQIAELINAKPKARRRVLEEAAGISGLYQRRHEAELKLSGAETNLTRVEDVIEQLEGQLATLARQAKQAARYRSILEDLRRAEGLVLYRRWREADQARVRATGALSEAVRLAAQGQTGASQAASLRRELEEKVPPRREEEAIAQAVLQRLMVERDTLADRESAARETVETLTRRIAQLAQDMTREEALAKDAGETINRLDWELVQIVKASEGQDDQIAASETKAQEAARVMQAKEADLDRQNEDAARLAARHSSAHRRLKEATDLAVTRDRAAAVAQEAVTKAELDLKAAGIRLTEADRAAKDAASAAEQAEAELAEADSARAKAQSSESEARATLGEADGEASALRAETAAVERVIARDRAEGGQLLDAVRAAKGYEAALGAALSDDLKAPVLAGDGASGWAVLDGYDAAPALPAGAQPLATQVRAPAAL